MALEEKMGKGAVNLFGTAIERIEAEKALNASEERFKRLYKSDTMAVCIATTTGFITSANKKFRRIFDCKKDEFPISWTNMTPNRWKDLDKRAVESLLLTGVAPPWKKEFVHKNGNRIPVMIGCTLLEGSMTDCICIIMKTTESVQTQEELTQKIKDVLGMD